MILYLDTSALVKRYIDEVGTDEVQQVVNDAVAVATSVISRAEAAAALAKAVRMDVLSHEDATAALRIFRAEWPHFVRIPATEAVITRADLLAWEAGLRGYDAVQLSSALTWRDSMDEDVTFAAFDRKLRQVASERGLTPFPRVL